ncbi:hypothetical protein ALC62_01549 [Cyphomyrmex costatus]|uniref:Uncharacterized protein n=1 Tax=Cyphomyrmex costatus TaxID=456900 RepID=A0A195D374_9HYME|nr:hypothetical protein ALC62_01549 [Cyphomyrmex costatus]
MGGNRAYRIFKDLPSAKNLRRNERRSAAEKNKRTRVYVRGKPGAVYRSRGRYTGARRIPGNKYNKESDATRRERRGMDKERRKRRTGRKNEDDGNKRERRFSAA